MGRFGRLKATLKQAQGAFSPDADDERLISQLAVGDLRALEMLYQRYVRPVFSLAYRILDDAGDAEEVTQDVFERVWRHAPNFNQERGRFATWLLSMTHHVSIDLLRKRQRRPRAVDSETAERISRVTSDQSDDVLEQALRSVEAERVRQALLSLPESQQKAIELAYFKGMSHMEIAALLGDPLGTVKTRIKRGMERLKAALMDDQAEDNQ
jgi:RNA polymerase sigma-70 factor, ECF subfamily